ncbi:MAG: hypothetical protein PHI31_09780 [Desulfuromonadaceae bacterium]|nr:hypothetical protein [Desulfuromonadaceae bacterium]
MALEPTWKIAKYRDFTGGENRVASPELLLSNQIFSGINLKISADGSVETRRGKTKINTTSLGAGPILSAFRWAKENGTKYITVQHGTVLYNATWDGVSEISSFTSVKTGLTAGVKLRGVVWKDNLHLVNGTQNNFAFDGTACTDHAGTPPKSTIIKVYANRLWINDVSLPNLLRFSDLESFDVWDTLNVIKFRSGDGDAIKGAAALPGGMVVFKQASAWTMYGTNIDNIRVDLLSDYIGVDSDDSILSDGIFVGPDNFYRFNLSSITPFSSTHKEYISILTAAQKQAVSAVYVPDWQCAIISLRDFRQIYVDAQTGAIFTWTGLNVSAMATATVSGDDGSLIVGDADNGNIYIVNNLEDDDGAAIPTDFRTSYVDLDSPRDKVFRAIRPNIEVLHPRTGKTPKASLIYDVDFSSILGLSQKQPPYNNTLTWGEGKWGENTWVGPHERTENETFYFSARGRFLSIRVSSETRIKIKSLELKFRNIGRDL